MNVTRKHLNKVFGALAFSFLFPLLAVIFQLPLGSLGFAVAFLTVSWLFLQHRNKFTPILLSPASVWLILMVYHFINLKFNVGTDFDLSLFTGNILPCFILYLCTYIAYYDFNFFIRNIVILYLVFIIFAVFAYLIGNTFDFDGRIGIKGFHPNVLGQYAGYYCLLLSIYIICFKPKLIKICLLLVPPLTLIFYSESRNSFVILMFGVISYIIGYGLNKKLNISTIVKSLLMLVVFYYAGMYLLDNTSLGERLLSGLSGDSSQVKLQYASGTIFDTILGERVMYYVMGFEIFPNHPTFGIGLWNFVEYNPFEMPFHTEYMVHLVEGGLIAFSIDLIFIIRIIKLFITVRHRTHIYYQLLVCFVCILINGITARIFPYNQFFCVFGAIIGYLMASRKEKHYENSI